MKKVKYLLGLSIIGLGLLINQSFGDDLYVDGNFITPVNSTTNQYSSYLYHFNSIVFDGRYGSASNSYNGTFGGLGYNLYYDNSIRFSGFPYCSPDYSYFNDLQDVQFNNSILSYSPFNWFTATSNSNGYKCPVNSTEGGPIKYLLGYSDTSIGKNFIYLGTYTTTGSVKFGIGNGFAGSEAGFYDDFSTSDSDYLRILYRSSVSTNNNPFNTLNPVNLSGSENFNNGDFLWEIYYPRGTRNNYGYVIDDGYYYTKYKHFGGFQLGYSYTFNRFEFTTGINRDGLGFRTVSDSIEVYQVVNGSLPYSEFSSYNNPTISNNYNYSWNGVLALKSNSYYSLGNGNGVYLLSKNPNNTKQVLYEHWSCELFNIDSMIKGTNNCVKLDGGLLTYNGTTEVLPFETKLATYDITSLNNDYPLLYDLLGDSSNSHGYTKLGNNCIYINQDERCYGFSSDSSVSILEIYLNQSQPGGDYGGSYSNSGSISLGSDCVDTQVCYDTTGDNGEILNICTTKCINPSEVSSTGSYIGTDGTLYIVNSPLDLNLTIKSSSYSNMFSGSFVDGSGILLSTYFDNYFSRSGGKLGVCPFPYSEGPFDFLTKVKIGDVYLFMPVLCFYSAFEQGRHITVFDDFDVNGGVFSQPLLHGDSENHHILFLFFDILFGFGILLLVRFLSHHLL